MSDSKSRLLRQHRWVRRLAAREPVVLASVLVIVTVTLGFIELADKVVEGETHHFDRWMLRAMRRADNPSLPLGPLWLQEIGRDITALGGFACLCLVTFATTGYLWLDRKRHLALFMFTSAASGFLVSTLLKLYFQRPRPDVVPHLGTLPTSTAFPSGHSMNAAVVYLTLGTIFAMAVGRKRLKAYVIGLAMLVTLLIGLSRVYLGVHYPTDVLGGWMAGLVWGLLCWLVARYLQIHGQVEKPTIPADEPNPDSTASESV